MPKGIKNIVEVIPGNNENGEQSVPSRKQRAGRKNKPEATKAKPVAENENNEAVNTLVVKTRRDHSAASLIKPGKSAKTNTVKIVLQLTYHTKYGQKIFVSGNTAELGNNDNSMAVPLEFLDNDNWIGLVNIDTEVLKKHNVRYNYFLVTEDGNTIYDLSPDKIITEAFASYKEVYIRDAWNYAGYFENAFYTEPFQKVLLKTGGKVKSTKPAKHFTHIFKVKTPLLKKGQTVCLTGSADELGSWNKEQPVIMQKKDDDMVYSFAADLSNATFPMAYKYGIYDTRQQKIVQLEEGDNRLLHENVCVSKHKLALLNDGFVNLPAGIWRGAGVSVPVFSLRTKNGWGVGEFNDIKLLADWAKKTGLQLIQLLPLNDTTATHEYKDSYPYAAISAFALHPMYLNIQQVTSRVAYKSLLATYSAQINSFNTLSTVDYVGVNNIKWKAIRDIYPSLKKKTFGSFEYKEFYNKNKHWLVPYAAFCYYRDFYGMAAFSSWPQNQRFNRQQAEELLEPDNKEFDKAAIYCFVQFHLHLQLKEAAEYAHSKGIILKGDIPIGVARNGADAWQHPALYHMNMQAGAPPDDFAVKGQNWGFPTYNWDVMKQDHFTWWKQRFAQMSNYFDAFRIDHILGFFRIWSIPMHSVEGIMGHFEPCIPVHIVEFEERNIWFDYNRYCNPFITEELLNNTFGNHKKDVTEKYLTSLGSGFYGMKESFKTQRQVEEYFKPLEKSDALSKAEKDYNKWLKQCLFDLISNVIFFEEEGSEGKHYHFRFGMEGTYSYQRLEGYAKQQLADMYINYFFRRQDNFWKQQAMQKLPALKKVTDMLICGEDLGLVPGCVPVVMQQLGLLSLEIQRMPKQHDREFFHPNDAPYLSVVTPATHDMSTIRGWWEENPAATQRFYNYVMGEWGGSPFYCEPWINKKIVQQHLYSPAMWSIFQIQDLLGMDGKLRRDKPQEERINIPAIPDYYWRYRMHISMEDLLKADDFNNDLLKEIKACGRLAVNEN